MFRPRFGWKIFKIRITPAELNIWAFRKKFQDSVQGGTNWFLREKSVEITGNHYFTLKTWKMVGWCSKTFEIIRNGWKQMEIMWNQSKSLKITKKSLLIRLKLKNWFLLISNDFIDFFHFWQFSISYWILFIFLWSLLVFINF